MLELITKLIEKQMLNDKDSHKVVSGNDVSVGRSTEIYNENWLLKIVLEIYQSYNQRIPRTKIDFKKPYKYFTEAQLSSPFLTGNNREGYTNTDAIIGEYWFSKNSKAKVRLSNESSKSKAFFVVEAKINSSISTGVKNSKHYDQVTRTVMCMAHNIISDNAIDTTSNNSGFYVFAPASKAETIKKYLQIESILLKIKKREESSSHSIDKDYETVIRKNIHIPSEIVTWESIIQHIKEFDKNLGNQLEIYYKDCLKFNK